MRFSGSPLRDGEQQEHPRGLPESLVSVNSLPGGSEETKTSVEREERQDRQREQRVRETEERASKNRANSRNEYSLTHSVL